MAPDPRKPPPILIYHKQDAAKSQLETAILLWFNYGDPISIHALASAANEVYHGIGRGKGMPTIIQVWKKTLTPALKVQANKIQNFAKHANTDPDGKIPVRTAYAQLLMLDSVICHAKLFGKATPEMRCFFARFAIENPDLIDHVIEPERRAYFRESIDVLKLGERNRVDYLNEVLPPLIAMDDSLGTKGL